MAISTLVALALSGRFSDDRPAGVVTDRDDRSDAELGRLGDRGVDGDLGLGEREAVDVQHGGGPFGLTWMWIRSR